MSDLLMIALVLGLGALTGGAAIGAALAALLLRVGEMVGRPLE